MENASKALVIAGAILATLMIIGLGVVIITNVTGVINSAGVDQQAAQANNSQYESLLGDSVSSATVKQLLTLIRTNNITADTNDEDMKRIGIADKTSGTEPTELVSPGDVTGNIKAGTRYKVSVNNEKTSDKDPFNDTDPTSNKDLSGYYKNGFIRAIKIEKANATSTTPSTTP